MKNKIILGSLAACFLTAACISVFNYQTPLSASGSETADNVVFVNGEVSASGDGSAEDKAVKTFEEGYSILENGGTLVLCGDIGITVSSKTKNYFMPEKSVTITGSYNGVDYKPVWTVESDGDAKANVQFTAQTELNGLTINRGESISVTHNRCVELWSGPSLTVGESVCFTDNGNELTADDKNGQIAVRLGHLEKTLDSASYIQKSGVVSFIQGGNNKQSVTNSFITLSDTAKVLDMLQCGGTNKDVGNSTVRISGNTVINKMYVNGYGSATLGNSDITILGGSINSLTATRLDTAVTGKISGNVNITVGNTAKIENLEVNENDISIEGEKKLTFSALAETAILSGDFGDWDTVAIVDGSLVRLTGAYIAPAKTLTVGEDSELILNSCFNSTLPQWQGNGNVTKAHLAESTTLVGSGDAYAVKLLMNVEETMQGTAVYGDYAFTASNLGYCSVYGISENKRLGGFWFASGTPSVSDNAYANHCNQMMFGSKKFDENDPFPLLYITTGNSGNHDKDGSYISKCAVERIFYDEENDTWTSELVQTIQFNDSANIPDSDKDGDLLEMFDKESKKFYYASGNGYDAAAGYQKIGWGWAASFVDMSPTDATEDKFFLFCPRFRTTTSYEPANIEKYGLTDYYTDNNYIITTFNMPSLPASENDPAYGNTVTLYPKDIIHQFETEYDIYVTQGGAMYQGRIYYSFGWEAPYGEKHANGIRIFDIATERIVSRIDLSQDRDILGTGEKEPECCAFYNGKLVLSAKGANNSPGNVLYIFDHIEFHVQTAATCTEAGLLYTVCGYCGERVSEIEQTPTLPHDMTRHAAIYATCTKDGSVAHYSCSVCQKNYADSQGKNELEDIVVKAGHKLSKIEAKAATETQDGNVEHYHCSKCDKFYSDAAGAVELDGAEIIIPALGEASEETSGEGSTENSSKDTSSEGAVQGCNGAITNGVFEEMLLLGALVTLVFIKKRSKQ